VDGKPSATDRFFQDAIWQAAFEMYENDGGLTLWKAPKHVQEQYKHRARKALSEYLATVI
jgi:hypothetical protein